MLTYKTAQAYVADHFKNDASFAFHGEPWVEYVDARDDEFMIHVPFALAGQEADMAVWVSDDGAPHLYGEW
jgi:hypothetical protein